MAINSSEASKKIVHKSIQEACPKPPVTYIPYWRRFANEVVYRVKILKDPESDISQKILARLGLPTVLREQKNAGFRLIYPIDTAEAWRLLSQEP